MKQIYIEAAPMAGFTDLAFRRVLNKCGCDVTYTEMVSATALFYKSKKTLELLKSDSNTIVQLFGKVPSHFEYAIKSGLLEDFKEMNINMGCPASKIIKNGEGAALMKNITLAKEIIETCVRNTDKPVSVKFRLGFDEKNKNAIEFAKMCEEAGASKIIVHGRVASQGYSGIADWKSIAEVVKAVKIPVIANGDIKDVSSAVQCVEITKAHGAMIGRALLGSPWICQLQKDKHKIEEKHIKEIIRYHIEQSILCYGEKSILEMRKHLLYYCSHLADGKELKKKIAVCKSFHKATELMGL